MSTEYPKISIRLQELINQANNSFPSTGEAIMAAYNQAVEEVYTPRQAKNILYNNVHFLDERTIRRYLPLEAKDTEKIRSRPPTADNGAQKSAEKDPLLNNQGSDQMEVTTGTITYEENKASISNHKNILSFSMTIMKLENILKNKDKFIIELLGRNEGLGTENQKLKEKMQANISEVLRVKVEFQRLYRDMLLIRNLNTSQAIISISNGKYLKLDPA
jgi:hypothetical protein